MRFDELVIKVEDGDLRLPFHPQLTILSGLGILERQSFADSILGALTGGSEQTVLRCTDGADLGVTVVSRDGQVVARYDADGSPAPLPVGSLAATAAELRALMLVKASDLGVRPTAPREDEPQELQEARTALEELTQALEEALRSQSIVASLDAELEELDGQIATARDNMQRREYAQVLAQLERVRGEAAAVQAGTKGIEADRRLLASADGARDLAARWAQADARARELAERFGGVERMMPAEVAGAAEVPADPPADLAAAVDAVVAAQQERDALDRRLQELAVATLPAPSDPLVAELGLIDQDELWAAAERLIRVLDELDALRVAHGGLGADQADTAPTVLQEIEAAHRDLDEAEHAAEAVRIPGVAASGLGLAVALAGALTTPLLVPVGLVGTAVAGTAMLLLPKARVARAASAERAALEQAGAGSYLGFHLRRVDASIDPQARDQVEAALGERARAAAQWAELVGDDVDVRHAASLADEVRAYHVALRELGGAADEIEALRRELDQRAEPALAQAADALVELCAPYAIDAEELEDPTAAPELVQARIGRGRAARLQAELEAAEVEADRAQQAVEEALLELGVVEGTIAERAEALEAAVAAATERKASRARARPLEEIDAERRELETAAQRLRRPEWGTVSAAEADVPDIAELEDQRAKVAAELAEVQPDVDVERLADRQAACERRVAALEARHGGTENGDPGAVADIQQHLLGRLSAASTAGPHGDPVPVLLDEAFLRVPADRKWDLLDLLLRLADRHQVVYLSDDAFVAAWARQQAADGKVTLLEPAPA